MTQQVNVTGWFAGQIYNLSPAGEPGDSTTFVVWGDVANNGVVAWMSAKPFFSAYADDPNSEVVVEVTHFQHESNSTGYRLYYTATNVGSEYIEAIAIYFAYTDVITQ